MSRAGAAGRQPGDRDNQEREHRPLTAPHTEAGWRPRQVR